MKPRQFFALALGVMSPLISLLYLGQGGIPGVKYNLWLLAFSPAPEMQGYPYALYRLTINVEAPGMLPRSYSEREIDQTFRSFPLARVSLHRTLRQPDQLAQQGAAFLCGHPELEYLFPSRAKVEFVFARADDRHVVEVRCP